MAEPSTPDPAPIRHLGMPLWTDLPTTCPGCGAAVNQAEACRVAEPRCAFCRDPLPCVPSPERLQPGALGTRMLIELHLYAKAEQKKAWNTPIMGGMALHVWFHLASGLTRGTITLDQADVVVLPGETVSCSVELLGDAPVVVGEEIELHVGNEKDAKKNPFGHARVTLLL